MVFLGKIFLSANFTWAEKNILLALCLNMSKTKWDGAGYPTINNFYTMITENFEYAFKLERQFLPLTWDRCEGLLPHCIPTRR